MTNAEILVIIAAAAVFAIINIIMWTVIAKKEKKQNKQPESSDGMTLIPADSVPAEAAAAGFELIESIVMIHTDDRI